MALVPITIRVDGDAEYSRAFDLSARLADDLREPLRDVGAELIGAVSRQFASEGASELGTRWQPLSPAYAAWKQANYPGRPMLVRTGEMRSAAVDARRALTITPRRLTYTVDSDYAIHHHRGEGVPSRRFVVLSTVTRRSIDRVFASWLQGIYGGPMWRAR